MSKNKIFTNGYALLIGVGECPNNPKLSLPASVRDVQALHQVITNSSLCAYPNDSQHIRLLHDETATRSSILQGLEWLKNQTARDSQATAIIYYSGHGWLDQTDNSYYLLPSDIDPFDFKNSALPALKFIQALRQINSQRLLIVIDSCHAAGMATSKTSFHQASIKLPPGFTQQSPPKQVIDSFKQGKGRVVFTSSQGNESSWVMPDDSLSLYTYHFIEALQGAANKQGHIVVKVSDLMGHLSTAVPETAKRLYQTKQTPFFDFTTEDFAIALLQGGKGLPDPEWHPTVEKLPNPQSVEVQASGNRSVAIGRDANGAVINIGDRNNVR
ncbi:MAG: caspase family protein [Symploca sp. SIO1A3]|nr:caspase family protein [Symploca sp. SIO1A3]